MTQESALKQILEIIAQSKLKVKIKKFEEKSGKHNTESQQTRQKMNKAESCIFDLENRRASDKAAADAFSRPPPPPKQETGAAGCPVACSRPHASWSGSARY